MYGRELVRTRSRGLGGANPELSGSSCHAKAALTVGPEVPAPRESRSIGPRGEMRVASYNSYRRIRRIHVDPALGQVLAGKLTRAQLSTYYAAKMRGSKKRKPLSETTVAHHHAMLKTAYNWALEEELLLVNPALRVKNPPALRPKTRPVSSMGEIASTVIKARGLQVHAAGVLAGFSGLRVGEIAGLLWSDLDLTRGFVTVTPHRRRGRRRHAARVPAEERQGADRAAARRRLRRAARLARSAEGVPSTRSTA